MSKNAVEKDKKSRIMVFGTFDGLHPGHLNFFKQARQLVRNAYLIVSIARDKNVKNIKGQSPKFSERKRMEFVKKSGLADKVVLAGRSDHLPHIIKENPDIIALGYDQKAYVANLKKELESKKVSVKIFRLKPYKEKIYKNSLLKKLK